MFPCVAFPLCVQNESFIEKPRTKYRLLVLKVGHS